MNNILFTLPAVLVLASCGTYNSGLDAPAAHRDTVSGAAIGGLAGAIIGHQSGETRNGALIGTALGGLTGYVVGEDKDRRWRDQGYSQPAPRRRSTSYGDAYSGHENPRRNPKSWECSELRDDRYRY